MTKHTKDNWRRDLYDTQRPELMKEVFGGNAKLWSILQEFHTYADEWNKDKTPKRRKFVIQKTKHSIHFMWRDGATEPFKSYAWNE
jgi:hypothetical protein